MKNAALFKALATLRFSRRRNASKIMCDYIDIFFRFNCSFSNTVVSCFIDEMEDVQDFYSKNTIPKAKRCIKKLFEDLRKKYTTYA